MANDEIQKLIEKIEALPDGGYVRTESEGGPPVVLLTDDLKALTTANKELQTRVESAEARLTAYDAMMKEVEYIAFWDYLALGCTNDRWYVEDQYDRDFDSAPEAFATLAKIEQKVDDRKEN